MTSPCTRWDAATARYCGRVPTRPYLQGPRCTNCTPAALASQPEASEGACAPLRHYCLPDARCATWTWQRTPWRILATGGRDRTDKQRIWTEFDHVLAIHPNLTVVHGAAYPKPIGGVRPDRSADWLIHLWCQQHPDVVEEEHPADWQQHGRAAGPIRNTHLVALGADECLAFPGNGPGTRDCMRKAAAAGIPVRPIWIPTYQPQEATR